MTKMPMRPIIPLKIRKELQEIHNRVIRQVLEETDCLQTCLSCKAFDEDTELCGLCKLRPPARVIAFGCENWQEAPEDDLETGFIPSVTKPKPKSSVDEGGRAHPDKYKNQPPYPTVAPRMSRYSDLDDDIPF